MRNLPSFRYKDLIYSPLKVARILPIVSAVAMAVFLMKGDRPDPDLNGWASTVGSMAAARSDACAVLLGDGRVLLAGGENASGALNSVEVLQDDGRFHAAAPMNLAHSSAACALLPDGTVLVAGGRSGGGTTNAVELYDPAEDRWKPGPDMLQDRAGATVSVLNDGRVLIAGGEGAGAVSDSLEIYDPAAGTFLAAQSRLSSPRSRHAAAVLPDSRVLIAGGWDGARALASADLFDPASGQVIAAGELSTPRAGLSATTLLNGRVLLAGGTNGQTEAGNAEIFDPQTGRFTVDPAAMVVPRQGHSAILIPHNNTVLLVGGTTSGANGETPLAQTEIYIPWRHEFRALGSLETARTGLAAVALQRAGKLAVAGGRNALTSQRSAEILTAPVITTDKLRYRASENIQFSGSGWAPGQAVAVSIVQNADAAQPAAISTVTDATGSFSASAAAPGGEAAATLYFTATQESPGVDGKAAVRTAQTSVSSGNITIAFSWNCANGQLSVYAFGLPVCAIASGFDSATTSEQMAWEAPSGAVYPISASVSGGQAQEEQVPNEAGVWMLSAYPAGSCLVTPGSNTVCRGSADASGTFTVGAGQMTFYTAPFSIAAGSCSPAVTLRVQTGPIPVSPSFPTAVTLTSTSPTGQFFTNSSCTAAVNRVVVPANAPSTNFYYSDITGGTPQISAASTGLATGSQSETITIIIAPPTLEMAFADASIPVNGSTTLNFRISNSNAAPLAGIALSDILPAGLLVGSPNNVASSCSGGAVAAAAGSGSINLSGANLAANSSCNLSVSVTGTTPGTLADAATVTSTNSGAGRSAGASLSVSGASNNAPSVTTSFGTPSIPLNGSTSLSITISSPGGNNGSVSGISFTDALPAGLVVATPSGLSGSCGSGTITAAAGSGTVSLSSAALSQNASCTITFNVTGTTGGAKNNNIVVTSTNRGTSSAARAVLIVVLAPALSMSFGATSVPLNGSAPLTFTIANPNSSTGLTGVALTDTLPAGLTVATPSRVTGSCGTGTITAAAGSGSIALAQGTIASGGSCSFTVNATGTAAGAQSTTSGAVASNEGGTGNTASANIAVLAPPALSLAFGSSTQGVNAATPLTFTIANPPANAVALAGVSFSDALPAPMVVASPAAVTGSCGGTVTAAPGAGAIALAGGSVPVRGSCSIAVNVSAAAAGSLTDSAQAASSNGGTGNAAIATIQFVSSATHLIVTAPASAVAGTPVSFTVAVVDSSSRPVTSYTGTLHFTSSDSQASLPANTVLSNGTGTFNATLKTAGSQTITAVDTANSQFGGSSAAIAVTAAAPAAITVVSGTPQSASINSAFSSPLQALVKDGFGNPASGARVMFSVPSSGASAVLSSATPAANAAGVASVTATANAVAGGYSVTAAANGATTTFALTNDGPVSTTPLSIQLNNSTSGTYTVPAAAPYASLGSFYYELRIHGWTFSNGACSLVAQTPSSLQYGPSAFLMCDPSYGWGSFQVAEMLDATPDNSPLWLQSPNIAITSASATNPMTITLASTPFPATMAVGSTILIAKAAGTGCSGMNSNLTITAVSGNTLTLNYDGTGCAYTSNSGLAFSEDFVVRYHRDLTLNQVVVELWNVDGSGYELKSLPITQVKPLRTPEALYVGAGDAADLAYLRWYSGTIPLGAPAPSGTAGGDLGDWEFEGNGNDSSGNNLNVSFNSTPTYVPTPAYAPACNAGTSQSFAIGQPATLDGSASFPMDGGSTLTYSWTQVPSTAGGVPLQNLTWSSTTQPKPTVTGLAFGPANFQLTVTQSNGQSSSCTVHDGAVAVDNNGVVTTSTGNASLDSAVKTLIGPMVQLGRNPWPFYDQAAVSDAAVQIGNMDRDYAAYWDVPNTGTVTVTLGSQTVTGVGTTFTTTFCQGPANPTAPQANASIIVWYPTGRVVNGAPETGRRRMYVASCASDTQMIAHLPSDNTGWTSDAQAGSGLNYTAEYLDHWWDSLGAPANFYDNVQAYYALYYRSGIDTYLLAARKLADRFWTSPQIDRGMAFNVGDWFAAQAGRSNEISGLVLRALDTADGHPDMWAGMHNVWTYTNLLLVTDFPYWATNGGIDPREYGYSLAQATYGAMWDTDPNWQAYCRAIIESTFQPGTNGIWPANLDPVEQGWLQWYAMKSTFDTNQAWSGSTVTLTNGSNVVACAGGNCGWQASDFVSYDVNTGVACANGSTTCGTPPVLFTNSGTLPANSSQTDAVSYCYPNPCTFVDSNHFMLDRAYAGATGTHGWAFGVVNGNVGAAGVVGYGALPYMEGILGWALDLSAKAMACNSTGVPANCDNNTSNLAYSYSAMAANWIANLGVISGTTYGIAYYAGFPVCGASASLANLWCNRADSVIADRELMGDGYRGMAAAYRQSPTPAMKTILDNWYAGMWAKPGTNPLVPSPDGQYDANFDATIGGFFITDGPPYSQKFFAQHFGISNEAGWPAIRLGY